MNFKSAMLGVATIALIVVPSAADARSQMRAVGSSTVYPFAKMVAERVARANPRLGTPIIESTGTGGGMKLFCGGVGARFPDVANASRRMKASEGKACAANGVTQVTEIQVGLDGVAVATDRKTPLSGISQADLYANILAPGRCSSTSRTLMPAPFRQFALLSPNSPRKARWDPTAI